jgi:intracellular multiplication protein IcmV
MKNTRQSRVAKLFNRIINIPSWIDWDRTKSLSLYLLDVFQKLIVLKKAGASTSFEAVTKQLNLSDEDLLQRQKGLLRMSLLMLLIAFLIFFYDMYLFIVGGYLGGLLGLVLMLIALTLAFRYHFWYFQIKHRKLNCSLKEWYKQGLKGGQ